MDMKQHLKSDSLKKSLASKRKLSYVVIVLISKKVITIIVFIYYYR
jgi:hypothetical protein